MKTLVLTGWGWKEYAVAAAAAHEALGGDADVSIDYFSCLQKMGPSDPRRDISFCNLPCNSVYCRCLPF